MVPQVHPVLLVTKELRALLGLRVFLVIRVLLGNREI